VARNGSPRLYRAVLGQAAEQLFGKGTGKVLGVGKSGAGERDASIRTVIRTTCQKVGQILTTMAEQRHGVNPSS